MEGQPARPVGAFTRAATTSTARVRLITPIDPGQATVITPHISLTLHHAGHILGFAWARLELTGGRRSCTPA